MSFLLLAVLVTAQPPAPAGNPPLPAYWHGAWVGTLHVSPEKGDPHEMPMSLEIRPLPDGGRYTFRVVYGSPDKTSVRDYELVPHKDKPGRFTIDEKNGIKLEAMLNGNTLRAMFQVGGALVQSRYERVGDVLRVEMTAYNTAESVVTKPTRGAGEVKAFVPSSVQTAELKRLPEP